LDESEGYIEGGFIDITQKKHLEERLLQSQKLEALGRMAGGVAHDFNNILAVINGYTEMLLLEKNLPEGISDGLLEIQKAYQRATDLTGQLRSFSREQKNPPKHAHLQDLVTGAEKMLLRLLRKNISLRIEMSASNDLIAIVPGQIEQVLINLVLNAVDAMPQGGAITIETENVYLEDRDRGQLCDIKPGQYIRLRVFDTGCGMDEETKKKIFEPFFTTKGEGEGTGLGLSTVFGIVKNCGGSISVQSEVNQGTIFNIFLPIELIEE
jgi:signal transduction histidine kinase